MKNEDLQQLGIPVGAARKLAFEAIAALAERGDFSADAISQQLVALSAMPQAFLGDAIFGALAQAIVDAQFRSRAEPAPWRQWGDDLEETAVQQIRNACELPISVAGALMPDAHVGYGLPIGGVLATENAVVPYAVGVDIACRMKLTVLDVPLKELGDQRGRTRLANAIESETRFGIGATFKERREHPVMDLDWSVSPITERNKNKAWSQLGTSGSGNHFVEFGVFRIGENDLSVEPGEYLALLSHSGSRGTGAMVCDHYSKLAQQMCPGLPQELRHLAWLDLNDEAGQEYWAAMNLMGEYAAANHACIHRHIAANLGAEVLLDVENHHNFAWKETHFGREVIVHRKGATPAHAGVLGIIPGSMASPAYLVRGKGQPDSLASASHGAGRVMSRTKANKTFKWHDVRPLLTERKVTLLSAGIDEVPMVYKDIDQVMAAQQDLVDTLASFEPRIVKMARSGERPED